MVLQEKILFGNKPTPELFAILTVYFVQGILGLARLAISFFLKDDLGLTPAQVAALAGIAFLPWVIKPVFGFLSDGLPILGYRRRSYLIFSGILGSLAWLALATVVDNPMTATIAILASSLSVAISDVIVDSVVVERVRKESLARAGSLQSLCWATSALGGLITAYLSGWLLQQFSTQVVFGITATFPLLVSAIAGLIVEEKITDKTKSNLRGSIDQIKTLWGAIKQKSIWMPTAFIFLWQATPNADSAFFFFTTNELGFDPEFLGRVRLVTSIAGLLGVWLYQAYLKNLSFRVILGWSTFISAALGMTMLLLVTHANRAIGIDDRLFSLGDSLVLTVMGQIAFMPVLVLSARLCPKGIEATLFALLMSIWNLSMLLSQELGSLLTHWLGVTETNFDNLWLLVIITNLSTLIPLLFLNWLPGGDPQEIENKTDNLPPTELAQPHSPLEPTKIPDLVPNLVKPGKSNQ
ncbi:MAG: folate/biopterin family MFS transporter [Prochloraceae cyanobacterium]